jgi:glucose dehydrogenase
VHLAVSQWILYLSEMTPEAVLLRTGEAYNMRYSYLIHVRKDDGVVLDSIWTNEAGARDRQQELFENGYEASFIRLDPNKPNLDYTPRLFYHQSELGPNSKKS